MIDDDEAFGKQRQLWLKRYLTRVVSFFDERCMLIFCMFSADALLFSVFNLDFTFEYLVHDQLLGGLTMYIVNVCALVQGAGYIAAVIDFGAPTQSS